MLVSPFKLVVLPIRLLVAARDRRIPSLTKPLHRAHNLCFLSLEAVTRFGYLKGRKFICQKILPLGVSTLYGAQQLIEVADLLSTVRNVKPFNKQVVYEFYANLADLEIRSSGLMQVYVRGKMFEFSPSIINRMFDIDIAVVDPKLPLIFTYATKNEVSELLSGGHVKRWKYLTTARFTQSMIMLHKISCFNWYPTTNLNTLQFDRSQLLYMIANRRPFNFGQFVYDHVRSIAAQSGPSNTRLAYPNLIYQILCFQREVPVYATDKFSGDPAHFAFDAKSCSQLDTPLVITPRMELADDLSDVIELLLKMKARLADTWGDYDDPESDVAEEDGVASDGDSDTSDGDGSDGDGDRDASVGES
ncbi:PREDICTED: uncharacterized protein LOC104715134 [Camelina sativa]|uniref:Uncharacterized protein LOC104715134 n=1 Tax=Camelina sativa TaxID=90675 RepID=A0ABM0TT16_CAMSA|nr:PREDICTED: uncharacterized protein LOC104715134 [Camelina sativa]